MAASQSETLELLLEIGRLLSSKLDLGELLKTVLQLAARVVSAESASVLLLDEKTQELYFDVALDLGEQAGKVRLALGQGIAGSVAKAVKPEIINDVRADSRWSPAMDAQSGFTTRSILAVPMTLKGRMLGVVEAINKRGGDFTPEDLRTFEAFASQASVAIDNARLFSSLTEEKLKLDTVFTEMSDGAVLTDPQGRIVLANGAARRFMGAGEAPATIEDALADMVLTPSLHEIFTGGKPFCDFAAAREQPKKLILAGRITRLELGWLCVFRDETEEWQKEKLKRTFLSLISHKLKTPLASVTGFSDLMLEDFAEHAPSPLALKAAQTISQQGKKLADLVDKLLRYTTLENPEDTIELAPVPVDQIVSEALGELRPWLDDNKAAVDYEGQPGAVVVGDKNQLREVVKNLVENAAKFDPKPEKKVSVRTLVSERTLTLQVRDTGRGIPPEDQEKVFSQFHQIETFFTGQMDGWGLGLPFVKKVVENHGGTVSLQSKLGAGTTISISLPRRVK